MQRVKAFLVVSALVLTVGCSKQSGSNPDDAIGMGAPAPAQATPAQPEPPLTAVRPSEVAASNGRIDRVIESCNVEQVNGQPFGAAPAQVSRAQPVSISGWGVDKEAGSAASEAELWLINAADAATHAIPLVTALREDVATSFGLDPAVAKPGLSATFDVAGLAPGDYKLLLVLRTSGKAAASCDNGRVVTIAD